MADNGRMSCHGGPHEDHTQPASSAGSVLSVGSTGSLLSIGSAGSILSIGSAGSVLSIGSTGSVLSIGSAFSVGSIGSAMSLFSIGSFQSITSVLSGQSDRSLLSWQSTDARFARRRTGPALQRPALPAQRVASPRTLAVGGVAAAAFAALAVHAAGRRRPGAGAR